MDTQAECIIATARTFLGTRHQHQGHSVLGIDCCGFIVEVAVQSGAVTDATFEQDYRRHENGERMLELLQAHLVQVDKEGAQPGDVLALIDPELKYPDDPMHLGILTQLTPYWKIIHSSERGVCEHRMDAHWKLRIHSAWRVPRVEEEKLVSGLATAGESR